MCKSAEFDRRLSLVNEALDRYGTYLLNYARELCRNNCVDADVLFDDLWILALERFPKDKLTHVGHLRLKLYQLFVDAWRKQQRNPVTGVEELPEERQTVSPEILSTQDEVKLKQSFFEEHPVNLSEQQQTVLFLWARYGFTHAEISEKTGIPRSTVADWVKLGRDAVINYVQQQAYTIR